MDEVERLMRQPPHRRFHEDVPRLGETTRESREWWGLREAAKRGISAEEYKRRQATRDANRRRSMRGQRRQRRLHV